MKNGDIVTIDLGENSQYSNTYIVHSLSGEEVLVHHPLFPELFIKKQVSELNKVGAKPKNSLERCLDYASKHRKYLSHQDVCELEGLIFFLIVRKFFSIAQKERLSALCEKIARVYCNGTLAIAFKVLRENKPLLMDDAFNSRFYRSHEKFITGKNSILSPRNEVCIYRMVGFALAQID